MLNRIFLVLSLAIVPFFGFCDEIADSVYEADPYVILMGEADQAIADKNWPEAASRLKDALSVKPNHPSNVLLLNNLAKVYTYQGLDSLALSTYNQALELAPKMNILLLGRAKTYLALGKDKSAMSDFENVLQRDSLSTEARFYHGMMSLYSGNKKQAEKDFTVLGKVAPQSMDAAIAFSTLYSLTGRDREAIPYLERLIEMDPAVEYYASLAGCYLEIGKLSEASGILSDAFKLYPNDPELYYYRAWLNRERFRLDDAKADAKMAIKLGANPRKVRDLFVDL